MNKDYDPYITYLKHSDKPFLELREVAEFTGTQHVNLRILIDKYIERGELTFKDVQPMTYFSRGREIDSYHVDGYALGVMADLAPSFSSKGRRDMIDNLIDYLHLEECAETVNMDADDAAEPEIAVEVPQAAIEIGPEVRPRTIHVQETPAPVAVDPVLAGLIGHVADLEKAVGQMHTYLKTLGSAAKDHRG